MAAQADLNCTMPPAGLVEPLNSNCLLVRCETCVAAPTTVSTEIACFAFSSADTSNAALARQKAVQRPSGSHQMYRPSFSKLAGGPEGRRCETASFGAPAAPPAAGVISSETAVAGCWLAAPAPPVPPLKRWTLPEAALSGAPTRALTCAGCRADQSAARAARTVNETCTAIAWPP